MTTLITQAEAELKLKKAHIKLMKHPETYIWSGLFLLGESSVVDDFPTACTDGKNKYYGREFLSDLSIEQTCALVLHENLHVGLRHIARFKNLMKKDDPYIGAAVDYAVNDIITNLEDRSLCVLPIPHLYDAKFHGWSVMEIYNFLRQNDEESAGTNKPQEGEGESDKQPDKSDKNPPPSGTKNKKNKKVSIGGQDYSLKTLDEHDTGGLEEATAEELKQLEEQVKEALEQGALLAGCMKGGVPRAMREALAPEVNWKEESQDFVTVSCSGVDDLSWQSFNRRRVADDYYLPKQVSERISELITGIDVSGSIGQEELSVFATHLMSICEVCKPDRVRILWWDTDVGGEQIFEGDYSAIKDLLKPVGGGGTRAGCVSEYIRQHCITADCILMLTDGYCETNITWDIQIPTMWLVTQNPSFNVPSGGRMVKYNTIN